MDPAEERRQKLLKSLHQAIELIRSNGDVVYLVCVRLRDAETQRLLTGLLSNLSYRNAEGTMVPATPGMLMDVVLEAMMDNPNFCEPEQEPEKSPPTNWRN